MKRSKFVSKIHDEALVELFGFPNSETLQIVDKILQIAERNGMSPPAPMGVAVKSKESLEDIYNYISDCKWEPEDED